MNIFNKLKNILKDDKYYEEFDPRLDEFDYTIEGEFLFDNEKYQIIFFYNHILNISYNNEIPDIDLAISALYEDKEAFFKLLSYLRDVRGLGNKKAFRYFIKELADEYSDDLRKYIHFIPYFGRYDDLYEFFDTELESDVINFFKVQLDIDKTSDSPSNLAKWLKSINASNKNNNILGKRTAKLLNLSYQDYRKLLSTLRKKINIVETSMSANDWGNIQYGSLTKKNFQKYSNAFIKHDSIRFENFLKLNSIPSSNNFKKNPQIFNPLLEKYTYLEVLKDSFKKELSFIEYSKRIKMLYRQLAIKKENWVPVILLNNLINIEDLQSNQISTELESIFLSLFCLCTNSEYYQNYIIKSKGTPILKRVPKEDSLKNLFKLILNNSFSNEISIESVFDLLLLSHIKKIYKNIPAPNGVVLVLKSSSVILDKTPTNICSLREKIAFLYTEISSKWLEAGISAPQLKIWIIEDNPRTEILDKSNNEIFILKGSGEAAFETLIRHSSEIKENPTHSELKKNLIEVLINERYTFCNTFNL